MLNKIGATHQSPWLSRSYNGRSNACGTARAKNYKERMPWLVSPSVGGIEAKGITVGGLSNPTRINGYSQPHRNSGATVIRSDESARLLFRALSLRCLVGFDKLPIGGRCPRILGVRSRKSGVLVSVIGITAHHVPGRRVGFTSSKIESSSNSMICCASVRSWTVAKRPIARSEAEYVSGHPPRRRGYRCRAS